MRAVKITFKAGYKSCRPNKSAGFTLIEMAISIMIIGLLLAPAIGAYNLYMIKQKIAKTEVAMTNASSQVNDFLNQYGRYPCPARMDARPEDLTYGFEDCSTLSMPGISVETSIRTPALANPQILIGSLPFRTLNLEESDSIDGYKSRITYAVTAALTDVDTYEGNLGGITLLNEAGGTSVVEVPDSVHFLLISHGEQNSGAIGEMGDVTGTCSGTVDEIENCNYLEVTDNPVFVTKHKSNDFDDVVNYSIGRNVTPWVYRENSDLDVHLRRGDSVIVGEAGLTTAASSAVDMQQNLRVRETDPSDGASGVLTVRADSGGTEGTVSTNHICDENLVLDPDTAVAATQINNNCTRPLNISGFDPGQPLPMDGTLALSTTAVNIFSPNPQPQFVSGPGPGDVTPIDIYPGLVGDNGGIACNNATAMVGIRNNRPLCSQHVQFNCGPGRAVRDVDANGRVLCSDIPPAECPAETVGSICGGSHNVPELIDGEYHSVTSGTCHMLPMNTSEISALVVPGNYAATLTAITNHINTRNNEPNSRIEQDCSENTNDEPDSALVRENYYCDAGTLRHPSETNYKQERGNFLANFVGVTNTSMQPEGMDHSGYQPFNPANPMSVPLNNSYHDCWCSESYAVTTGNCPSGSTGNRIVVRKYNCPRTYEHRTTFWDSGTQFCACAPVVDEPTNIGSCSSYFGVPSNSMTGDVIRYTTRTCDPFSETSTDDISACRCPARSDEIPDPSPTACPVGETNNFTFEGQTYNNVSLARHRRWVCPGPNGVGGNVTSAAHRGRYEETTRSEPCACDGTITSSRTQSCSDIDPDQGGPGIILETQKDCASGDFVDTGVVLGGSCYTCTWQHPSSGGHSGNRATQEGSISGTQSCSCSGDSSGNTTCSRPGGSGFFVYNNCTCRPGP